MRNFLGQGPEFLGPNRFWSMADWLIQGHILQRLLITLGNNIKKTAAAIPRPHNLWVADQHTAIAVRLECCGRVRMGCVSAASVTFHLCKSGQEHQDELRIHFGNCMSKAICLVAKWQNTVPKTMIFLPPPSPKLHKERKETKARKKWQI